MLGNPAVRLLCGSVMALVGVVLAPDMAWSAAAKTPNILWVIAEDMSPDLSAYGTKEAWTPNLDALAARGVRYTRSFSTAPICSTSRSAFLTGMYQTSIGAQHHRSHRTDGYRLPAGVHTLPDRLHEAGYFTANVEEFPEALGFEGTAKEDWNFYRGGKPWDSKRWQDLKSHQPFYAQVNFFETHRGGYETIRETYKGPRHADPEKVSVPPYLPDHPVTRKDTAVYLDSGMELDRKVGLLLEQLQADGLADNTVVIFFSDHGQGQIRGKSWCYESGLAVPLVIYWPKGLPAPAGYHAGSVDDQLVQLIDVSATTLAFAGLEKPATMQGRVFLGSRTEPPRQYVYGARDRYDDTMNRIRSVRDARYRYIRNFMPERTITYPNLYTEANYPVLALMKRLHAQGKLTGPQEALMAPRLPDEELYDLEIDPYEIRNLAQAPEHQQTLKRMRAELERWMVATGDQGSVPEDPAELEAAQKEMREEWEGKTPSGLDE